MTSESTYYCPVCGATDCNDEIAKVPFGMASRPSTSGMKRTGRFFTTTDRVWRKGRLVVGIDQTIPWEEAQALGLVEPEEVVTPLIEAEQNPAPPPTEAEPDGELEEAAVELAAVPAQQAAIVRRPRKAAPKHAAPKKRAAPKPKPVQEDKP